jgi:hypothetical protein
MIRGTGTTGTTIRETATMIREIGTRTIVRTGRTRTTETGTTDSKL